MDYPPQLTTGDGASLPVGPGQPPRQKPGGGQPPRIAMPPEPPGMPPGPGRSPRSATPVGTPGRGGPPGPRPGAQPPSPTGSLRSVHSLTGTLAEQLAKERSAQ